MNGPGTGARDDSRTLVETALRHQRTTLAVLLVVLPLACWAWIVLMARDMYGSMQGSSAWMMTSDWDATHLLLLWAMWAAMMAAMMLPAAAPVLLLYAGSVRGRAGVGHPRFQIYLMAAGYIAAWSIFSAGATALQRWLAQELLLTPMMEPAMPGLSAGVLALAGLYQLTPLKRVCLRSCRSPLAFLMAHWHPGLRGAAWMGVLHGTHCLGCCWALMLILFAGGVMNLSVIMALTAWVLVEKTTPVGERGARAAGVLLLGLAAWTLWR